MAMITGKVQQYEGPRPDVVEVGTPFARQDEKGDWRDLNGKLLKVTKVTDLREKVESKRKIK